ncbi:MAG: nucleotidyltransferase domain-containing protein [Gemmatimonadetes bacterium]|nr:nucleotidyltransferase domain-containing protein [Gemmatimonadota bacterium]
MATLTIRGVPERTLRRLRAEARAHRRSLNSELLLILEQAAAGGAPPSAVREPAARPYSTEQKRAAATSILHSINRRAVAQVCREHHIRWLAVFGSQAKAEAGPDSDVDVIADFEPGMTPGLGIETVAEALRSVLGGQRVDLVTRRGLSPRLRDQILPTAVPLYGT